MVWELLEAACRILFPDQGSNPGPLHWERGVLATRLTGKSQDEWSDRKRTNLVCSLFPPREDTTRYLSANQHVGHHQTSDSPSLQTVRNKFLVFKLSNLWYSLIADDVFNLISPQGFSYHSRVLSSPKPIPREFFSWGSRPTPPVAQRTSLPQQLRDTSNSMLPNPVHEILPQSCFSPNIIYQSDWECHLSSPPSQNVGSFHIQSPLFSHHVHHSFIHSFKNTYWTFATGKTLCQMLMRQWNTIAALMRLNQSLNIVALCVCSVTSNSLQPLGL